MTMLAIGSPLQATKHKYSIYLEISLLRPIFSMNCVSVGHG